MVENSMRAFEAFARDVLGYRRYEVTGTEYLDSRASREVLRGSASGPFRPVRKDTVPHNLKPLWVMVAGQTVSP